MPLDRRTEGVAGAAKAAPHGMVQAFLNRSEAHLWGMVSNGRVLRVLRDHHSLTRQAFVEFDLEAIFDGEQFSDFLLLWLVCHQSRVEVRTEGQPESCWLEQWFVTARDEGVRALDGLRGGVENAIAALGAGFLRRDNRKLQRALGLVTLDAQGYYRELLRLVYRLIFLFVAEDREVLLDADAPEETRDRYQSWYATSRLRGLAGTHRGTAHVDQWRALRLVMSRLAEGYAPLALPALGSFLWRHDAVPHLMDCELSNEALYEAVRHLAYTRDDGVRRPVSWKNLGAEELGSVYEALLELHPRMNREAGTFALETAAGHERKTTGSYYTPTPLVEALLDTALDPVLDEAARAEDPERAILDLKVVDPACGSGHFLVAAGRRMARRLAATRTEEEARRQRRVRKATRDVVGRCLFGVDLNPMAVELCKVSLWMEAVEPGGRCRSWTHTSSPETRLLGTTPALMAGGIPDDAWKPLTGDDKKIASKLRKRNKDERKTKQVTFQFSGGDHRRASRGGAPRGAGRRDPRRGTAEGSPLGRPGRVGGVPQGAPGSGRLVQRLRVAGHGRRPGGRCADARGVEGAGPGPVHGLPGDTRRGPAAGQAVRVPALAPGVPPGLPRAEVGRGQRSRRVARRVRRGAGQSTLGASEAPGEGVLRVAGPGDRRRQELGGPKEADRLPSGDRPAAVAGVAGCPARRRTGSRGWFGRADGTRCAGEEM